MAIEVVDAAGAAQRERATILRGEFIVARNRALTLVRDERETMNGVVKKLRVKYSKLTDAFLRTEGTTYAVWLDAGPRVEWEEVLEATRDPSIWERLVERFAAPAKSGTGG
jgi:hypothetical protein